MAQRPAKTQFPLRTVFVCLALVLVTAAIYWPLRHGPFITYDDGQYVKENSHVNAGISWAGVKWAFAGGHAANWHPLTWLSHMLDCQWFGLKAGRHHMVNVLFHAVNSLLLFGLLRYLTGAFWRSAVVAALFAWHPMHVESVAWIAERKDVLSTFFWLLTVFAYARYCKSRAGATANPQNPSLARSGGEEALSGLSGWWFEISSPPPHPSPAPSSQEREKSGAGCARWYLLVCFLFALSLMSKPMVVTLPFVLWLLDFWPLQRREPWRRLAVEKLPLLALSAACCWITFKVQANDHAVNFVISRGVKVATALIAYACYLGKLFWPAKLAVFYPYVYAPPAGQIAGAVLLLVAISAAVVYFVRTKPYLLVGWCWFLGTLVPVIGLVQVGSQSMADRYTYVPAIGLFIAVVWLAGEIVAARPAIKPWAMGLAAAAVAGCAVAANRQAGYWQRSVLLFQHAIAVTTDNDTAEYNLANSYFEEDNFQAAAGFFEKSLQLQPEQSIAECDLALCLAKLGKDGEAADHYQRSLRMDDQVWQTHMDYGLTLQALGDTNGALAEYQAAIRLGPDAYNAHITLGDFYLTQHLYPQAKQAIEEAARLAPKESAPHDKLATMLNSAGQLDAAIAEYETALRLNAEDTTALNNLAWIRAANPNPAVRNGAEAVRLATRACELSHYQEPLVIGTLADAYAEAGQFKEAEDAALKARDLALAHDLKKVAARNEELRQLYRAHQAFHEAAAN